jgi:hypothetical protein
MLLPRLQGPRSDSAMQWLHLVCGRRVVFKTVVPLHRDLACTDVEDDVAEAPAVRFRIPTGLELRSAPAGKQHRVARACVLRWRSIPNRNTRLLRLRRYLRSRRSVSDHLET